MTARKKTKLFMIGNNKTEKTLCELQSQIWQSLTDSLAMFTDDFMERAGGNRRSRSGRVL